MKPNAYRTLAANEEQGWYYVARRRIFATLIKRFVRREPGPRRPLRILDVGCGTGGTSVGLRPFGAVTGLEPSTLAIELLRIRHRDLPVVQGGVDDLPRLFPRQRFDLVTAIGVLCSRAVGDPGEALQHIHATLDEGGYFVWNDCAYPILARQHDEFVEAARRFYPSEMRRMLEAAGFEVVHGSHLLGWGFPVALTLSLWYRFKRLLGLAAPTTAEQDTSDDRPLPTWVNGLLQAATYAEWRLGTWGLKSPVGVSYLVLARKRPAAVAPARSKLAA